MVGLEVVQTKRQQMVLWDKVTGLLAVCPPPLVWNGLSRLAEDTDACVTSKTRKRRVLTIFYLKRTTKLSQSISNASVNILWTTLWFFYARHILAMGSLLHIESSFGEKSRIHCLGV